MYTGPKDTSYFNILSTPAYKKVMENNINMDVSFNEWDVSLEKTLTQPKSALLASSWYENHCQVKLDFKYRHILTSMPFFI